MSAEVEDASQPPTFASMDGAEASSAPMLSFDLSKKKKKKKSKVAFDEPASTPSSAAADGLADDLEEAKLEDGTEDDMPGNEGGDGDAVPDFALPEFGGKKKKKKKKIVFDDDLGDGEMDDPLSTSDRLPRRDIPAQPWDATDRDYTYQELINRAFQFLHGKNPSLAGGASQRKKVTLQLPQVAREGTKKTVFLNFGSTCKSIHRQQDHLLAYLCAELGTTGNIQEGGRLVIKGRFSAEGIGNVLKRYMLEYVVCTSCRSPDTVLMRDATTRLYFVSCESCGAKRSVAAIRQGFMAQVERRKKA